MNIDFDKTTCFNAHSQCKKSCLNKKCRYWHDNNQVNNCIINAVNQQNEYTLEEVGKFFNVTRMRICQIEKNAIQKIRDLNQVCLD